MNLRIRSSLHVLLWLLTVAMIFVVALLAVSANKGDYMVLFTILAVILAFGALWLSATRHQTVTNDDIQRILIDINTSAELIASKLTAPTKRREDHRLEFVAFVLVLLLIYRHRGGRHNHGH